MSVNTIHSPVFTQAFKGGKPSGSKLPMKSYPAEKSVNKQANGPGAHNSLSSPAPSKLLGGMPNDDRSNSK